MNQFFKGIVWLAAFAILLVGFGSCYSIRETDQVIKTNRMTTLRGQETRSQQQNEGNNYPRHREYLASPRRREEPPR